MFSNYRSWFEKYRNHISEENSSYLAGRLVAPNFPQNLWQMTNKQQYKQIKLVRTRNLIILTSMVGRSVKIFSLKNLEQNAKSDIEKMTLPVFVRYFKHQVIEVTFDPGEKYAFFSLTDFGKEGLKDKVFCLNLESFRPVFTIDTKGKWSKFICYHPDKLLLISNWNSNDLSIIDIKNIRRPKLTQLLPCGISPRGVAFTQNGEVGIVAGFYSRNITFLKYDSKNRKFSIDEILPPFDFPNYSGNMRHVVINKEDTAFVSNMGRSLIHKVDIDKKKIVESFPCATHPNTIVLSDDQKYLAVACRESNVVCLLKTEDGRIESIVDTGPSPTGLDFFKDRDGFYRLFVTNFDDDSVVCQKIKLE